MRGWQAEIVEEVKSGAVPIIGPSFKALLRQLKKGDALVVSKLDRLSRSTGDFDNLVKWPDGAAGHLCCSISDSTS